MKKTVLASLIVPALLTGCGSSDSSGSNSSKKYEWQIVQLKSVSESSLASTCIIYADSAINDGEVITAYIAEQDFNILYHNADGSIETEIDSDEISNGLLTIDSNDVPDEGYVTLEEISTPRGGDVGSYMFSVKKSLLNDMVLNISQDQTGSCYQGDDYRESSSGSALINVRQPSSVPDYYQSSYDEKAINGLTTASDIPVDSPYPGTRDILITAFDVYDSSTSQKTDLSQWAFIDSGNLFEDSGDAGYLMTAELSSNDLTDTYWSSIDNVDLDSDSGVIIIHDKNSYFWQPIYNDSDTLTVAYESSEINLWSSSFSGSLTDSNWLFKSIIPLSEDADISLPEFDGLDDSIAGVSILSSCSSGANFCLDTNLSYRIDNFDYQRVHTRLTEADGSISNITYQSIYSEVNEEPILLQTNLFDFVNPTLVRVEFNLIKSDADSDEALQYLMSQNIDIVSVGEYGSDASDDQAETDLYNDINGLIVSNTDADSLYQNIISTNTSTVMNAYE